MIIIQSLYYLFFLQILCFLFLWIVAHLQEWNELFVETKYNDHQHPDYIPSIFPHSAGKVATSSDVKLGRYQRAHKRKCE